MADLSDERLRQLITRNTRIRSVLLPSGKAARDCDDTITALRELERLRRREPPHCPSCECGEHILGPLPTGEGK